MDEDTEYIKLPLDDRCVHKLWKARVHGYEEATKLFQQIDDEKSPEWNKYLGLIKKFVGDSNVCAQEKGLTAALAYIENVHVATRTASDVMTVIVNKCMGSPKKSIKDLAVQITLMYIEIEKHEVVLDELIKGAEHKNPKIAATCVATITQALKEFGSKVISLKILVKKVPTLVEDRDKNVRDETKALIIEMYRWIGPPFRNQLTNLKPVQLQELNNEFDKLNNTKAVPTRLLRSQQAKKAVEVVDQNGADAEEDEDEADGDDQAYVDPYDLVTAVNILTKLPKNFYEKLEEKKWQERKESLDCLEQLLQNVQKLETGDYGDLIRALKKVILKDSNVLLVGIAAKCMATLGSCLKKRFQSYAGNLLLPLLEKFKEKKQNVVLPLRDAVDAIYESLSLEQIQEDVLTAMDNKNPSVKAETVAFLSRCFTKCTPIVLNKKLLKSFTTALIKTLNESDPTVRDYSAEAIGTAYKVVGEKAIGPFLADIDNIKLSKIKEASEKAVIVAKVPKTPKKKAEPAVSTIVQPVSNKQKAGSVNPKPVKRPPVTKVGGAIKKSTSTTSIAGNAGKTSKSSRPISERELTEEEVEEKAFEIFPNNMITGLSDNDWKVRLAATEQYLQIIPTLDHSSVQSQFLIRLLCKKPGLKDNNFQTLRVRLDCLKIILENFTLTSAGISACLFDIISLLADNKNGSLTSEILMLFAENLGLDYICNEIFAFSLQQKNPKVLHESIVWISSAVLEFGLDLQPKSLIENVKKTLVSSNSMVRAAAISLLGTMYLYMGSQLGTFLENEKPPILSLINKEFQKHQGERPPVPRRGKLKSKQSVDDVENDEYDEVTSSVPAQDMVHRVDISTKVPSTLISELSHRDWKVRMEAIGKLDDIIKEAKYISGNLGELAHEISQRVTDSNGRLATTAVSLVETIAVTMGSPCKTYIREFLPKLWQCLGDNKNYLRAAALKCINTWADICGCKELFEGEIIASALKAGNPALRAEMWAWLADRLPELKSVQKEELLACLPHLLNNLEDRNSDVRKSSNDAVLGFMIHIGYGPMVNAAEKLKPSSANVIKVILDRTRGNLPEIVAPKTAMTKQKTNVINKGGGGATMTKRNNAAPSSKIVGVAGKQVKKEETDTSPVLKINNLKMQRSIDESKLKLLKWNFTTPRDEFVDQLKEQMLGAGINKNLVTNMFHIDFKYHLKAIDILAEDFLIESKATTCNLDLILKWMTLRFFDTNPSVQIKGLEYLSNVFKVLAEEEYKMAEFEAAGFLPYLVIKTGDPKDTIRNIVRDIFHQISFIFPVSRIFSYVIDGLKSKNARQRAGCLDQLCVLIEKYGLMVCQPTPPVALKEIAKQISDRDNAVRNSALNCIVSAYFIAGDKVRQMIGQVSDKDMSLLDERIKRASKSRQQNIPVATVKPTQIAPQRRIPVVEPVTVADNNNYNTASDEDDEQEDTDEQHEEETENVQLNSSPSRVVNRTFTNPSPNAPNDFYANQYAFTELRNRTTIMCNGEVPLSSCVKFEWDDEKLQQKKGPFELDRNIMVAIESTPIKLPTFTPVEYDLRYFQETVLPITPGLRTQNTGYSTQTITKSRTKPNNLESWIATSSSTNLEEAMKSLEEIEYVILCDDRKKEFYGLEDQLFCNLCKQLTNLSKSEDLELAKCYKVIFAIIMKVYNNEVLCKNVKEYWIQKTLEHLLYLLFEKRLENMDRSDMFEKVVNNLVLKIINRSNYTDLTCALLKMLYDTVANPDTPSHYQELVMKCLWKVIKYFPEWDSQIDYLKIFMEIHRFLSDFPSSWWKKQPQDVPLRTYKTIAHTMAKLRGVEILVYINNIPNITEDAEVVSYVTKLLRHLKVAEKEKQEDEGNDKSKQHMSRDFRNQLTSIMSRMNDKNDLEQQLHTKATENQSEETREVKHHMSHELHNQLTSIISKIGDKNETEQGLKMLYEFKEHHPEVNIFQFLSKSSKYFQDYVKRGLEKINSEKGSEESSNEDTLKAADGGGEKFSEKIVEYIKQRGRENDAVLRIQMTQRGEFEEIETDAQDFKKRLKLLQKRAGWEPYQKSDVPISSIEQQTNFMPIISKPSPPRRPISQDFTEDRASIEELKHKLATLKESQY